MALVTFAVPSWASAIKMLPSHRVVLARTQTPIQLWNVKNAKAKQTWIKREDLTGFETSGNKIRKLEFLLADAMVKGCDSVITIGGLQSNHCRATGTFAGNFFCDFSS
jgi:D-cysteine desulfhydrase